MFYVAMTRARKTLTLCERQGGNHAFIRNCEVPGLRSRPEAKALASKAAQVRTWYADPEQVVLSWPGYFAPDALLHRVIAGLEHGSKLQLRSRRDGQEGWEVADENGVAVARMARKFTPPAGEIVAVSVAAILVRRQGQEKDADRLRCLQWELVLPEIRYLPE